MKPNINSVVAFINRINFNKDTNCWEWNSTLNHAGYGRFLYGGRKGKRLRAHRFAYEWLVSEIPKNKELDHLCKNKKCCNPQHLEIVTHTENMFRTRGTHCKNGHILNDKYIQIRIGRPNERFCPLCRRIKSAERQARLKSLRQSILT